jgi:hypothetical protein
MSRRPLNIRIWSLLAAATGLLFVGMTCQERVKFSVVNGSKLYIAQLLDPSNAAALVGEP